MTRHPDSIFLVWDTDMLDARVASSSAKALAQSVSITQRFLPQEMTTSKCPTEECEQDTLWNGTFPALAQSFFLHTPKDCHLP